MEKLRKQGVKVQPVEIAGRTIAKSFWGKGWCDHLESFSDYSNRLPRGRTYAQKRSVYHLEVKPGLVEARVVGSSLYKVKVSVKPLSEARWETVKEQCSGKVDSLLALLKGELSERVMTVVSHRTEGLFPQPKEITLACDCPDGARMCKHVAAVLYGVGHRLDTQPDLLFVLRQVDPQELLPTRLDMASETETLPDDSLENIFGLELDFDFTENAQEI